MLETACKQTRPESLQYDTQNQTIYWELVYVKCRSGKVASKSISIWCSSRWSDGPCCDFRSEACFASFFPFLTDFFSSFLWTHTLWINFNKKIFLSLWYRVSFLHEVRTTKNIDPVIRSGAKSKALYKYFIIWFEFSRLSYNSLLVFCTLTSIGLYQPFINTIRCPFFDKDKVYISVCHFSISSIRMRPKNWKFLQMVHDFFTFCKVSLSQHFRFIVQ